MFGDLVGFAGTAVLVVTYFFNQNGRLASDDWRYPGFNLAGSILLIVSLYFNMNLPSFAFELFWSAISIYGIWKGLRARRSSASTPASGPAPRPMTSHSPNSTAP